MSRLSDLGADHQRRRIKVAQRAVNRSLRIWQGMNPISLDAGWEESGPALGDVVAEAQTTAARQSAVYLNAIGGKQENATLVAGAFAGLTVEGREVVPELYSAVTTTKRLVGSGIGFPAAFRAGAAFLSVLVGTVVSDAGRSADSALAAARGFSYNVRVIQPGACSRCAILAGVTGYRRPFLRHPRCRCTSMPLRDKEAPEGFFRNTSDYFDSLPAAEQDRVFTKPGAEAIRLGADPAAVVNARLPNRRGRFSTQPVVADPLRRTRRVRVTPEQILTRSDSPEQAKELLRLYGYIR